MSEKKDQVKFYLPREVRKAFNIYCIMIGSNMSVEAEKIIRERLEEFEQEQNAKNKEK